LEMEDLIVGYQGEPVLNGLSLAITKGEVTALIGPNGAGKSTLFRTVAGLIPERSGRIEYIGSDIRRKSPESRARLGLALVPEGRSLFKDLTVHDNLRAGRFTGRKGFSIADVYDLFPRLADRTHSPAGHLSGGEQQMLALGRALTGGPEVLLVDEPSLGLAPLVTRTVCEALVALATAGMTVVLGEQNAHAAMDVASRCLVLAGGALTFDSECVTEDGRRAVLTAYEATIEVASTPSPN
jgi:branched-chain amino acid transport system ATP-binding protein